MLGTISSETRTAFPFLGAHFAINFSRSLIFVFIPLYFVAEFGYRDTEAAILMGSIVVLMYATTAIFRIPSGLKIDQIQKRKVVTFALLSNALVIILIMITNSIVLIALLLCFFNFGVTIEFISVRSFMGLISKTRLGKLQTRVTASGVIGLMVGSIVAGFVFENFEPRMIFLPSIIILLTAGLIFPFLACKPDIERIETENTINKEIKGSMGDEENGKKKVSIKERIKVLGEKNLRPIFLLFILEGMAAGMTTPYLSLYAFEVINVTYQEIGILIAIASGASAVFGFLVGTRMLDLHGTKPFIFLGLNVMAVGLIVEGIATNISILTIGIVIVYIGIIWFVDSSTTNALRKGRREVLALIHSGTGTAWYFGLIIGGPIGAFFYIQNPRLPFLTAAIIIFFAALIAKTSITNDPKKASKLMN
ncbi:MAG: MFS transporter [Candidatus Wukongarchaeota archaeon]|nr:MFS transporter [Candidatus Wukongarchaeota archaeon]